MNDIVVKQLMSVDSMFVYTVLYCEIEAVICGSGRMVVAFGRRPENESTPHIYYYNGNSNNLVDDCMGAIAETVASIWESGALPSLPRNCSIGTVTKILLGRLYAKLRSIMNSSEKCRYITDSSFQRIDEFNLVYHSTVYDVLIADMCKKKSNFCAIVKSSTPKDWRWSAITQAELDTLMYRSSAILAVLHWEFAKQPPQVKLSEDDSCELRIRTRMTLNVQGNMTSKHATVYRMITTNPYDSICVLKTGDVTFAFVYGRSTVHRECPRAFGFIVHADGKVYEDEVITIPAAVGAGLGGIDRALSYVLTLKWKGALSDLELIPMTKFEGEVPVIPQGFDVDPIEVTLYNDELVSVETGGLEIKLLSDDFLGERISLCPSTIVSGVVNAKQHFSVARDSSVYYELYRIMETLFDPEKLMRGGDALDNMEQAWLKNAIERYDKCAHNGAQSMHSASSMSLF